MVVSHTVQRKGRSLYEGLVLCALEAGVVVKSGTAQSVFSV